MPPTRPRPLTTIASIEHDPDPRTVERTDAPRASARQRVIVTIPAEPPLLTPGLARALGRIIVRATRPAEIVDIADPIDARAIAS